MRKAKKQTLFYQESTQTIRQAPENYLIAHKHGSSWNCDPDLACNKKFAIAVFTALLDYNTKYGSGLGILKSAGFENDPQTISK